MTHTCVKNSSSISFGACKVPEYKNVPACIIQHVKLSEHNMIISVVSERKFITIDSLYRHHSFALSFPA
jgi:hypothetical protein